jgi:hypothetical protein
MFKILFINHNMVSYRDQSSDLYNPQASYIADFSLSSPYLHRKAFHTISHSQFYQPILTHIS